jgi:hypothetical protein
MTEQTTNERIAALENAVADLQRELSDARRRQVRTMRSTRRCPSCGGHRLLHIREIKDMGHGRQYRLSLQKVISRWTGLVKKDPGTLEAFACTSCRLVEWHAASLDGIRADGVTIVEIVGADDHDGAGERTPYR